VRECHQTKAERRKRSPNSRQLSFDDLLRCCSRMAVRRGSVACSVFGLEKVPRFRKTVDTVESDESGWLINVIQIMICGLVEAP
jgi:hypothetical protein